MMMAEAAAAATAATQTETTLAMGHALRPSPPVNLLVPIKRHRSWASDEFVLRVARRKWNVFTSTSTATVGGQLHQCQPEDFVLVHEPLGVFACLKHMVVHRCGESWQQVRQWIDLPNNASSLQCRRIRVGGRSEPNWCCAISRQRLPNADALEMNASSIHSLNDLAMMVYGTDTYTKGKDSISNNVPIGGSFKGSDSHKRSLQDTFHLGIKRHALLKQTIDTMVDALVDPRKRIKYNHIVQKQRQGGGSGSASRIEPLQLEPWTPGIQVLLRHRLHHLCTRLLENMNDGEKIDLNSLVFFALRITVEGPQCGREIVAPRLPVRWLSPLPVETLFEMAFGIHLSNYSKASTRIQRITGDPRFARQMGWSSSNGETMKEEEEEGDEEGEKGEVTKYRESTSTSSVSMASSPSLLTVSDDVSSSSCSSSSSSSGSWTFA